MKHESPLEFDKNVHQSLNFIDQSIKCNHFEA